MGEDLEARLADAAGRLHRFQAASARAHDLGGRAYQLQQEIAQLRAAKALEDRDVQRLEAWSLTRVVAGLVGSRDDRLARERAEADAAAYRVAQAQARLDVLVRERTAAMTEVGQLASAPATYDALLAAKEGALIASTDPRGRRLLDLATERGQLTALIQELHEAIAAADSAGNALRALDDTLHSASDWSTYDMLGGGFVSSLIKHDRLDYASEQAAYADHCLTVLRTELADVDRATTVGSVQISGLTRFVDVWLDNIFTDWRVARRINTAQHHVGICAREVATLQFRLRQRADGVRARLTAIDRDRQALLTA
jgi:hypothetical protein